MSKEYSNMKQSEVLTAKSCKENLHTESLGVLAVAST